MQSHETLRQLISVTPATWLITGVAGFIGSNLLEALLKLDQVVIGLDTFANGYRHNLDEVKSLVAIEQWCNFNSIEGDIRNLQDCQNACRNVTHVLHQAALGSVPRSLADPIATNQTNIDGFLNILVASRDAKVSSFSYAAGSSTCGDHPAPQKTEDNIGKPLSPYAVTKYVNELYAEVFARSYELDCIGLRHLNVFGKREDPNGAYAAVIPKRIAVMIKRESIHINGNGETSRDFCFLENAVQANLREALSKNDSKNNVYNVAVGDRTSLNELFHLLKATLATCSINYQLDPNYRDFRPGDVMRSQADISLAKENFGYLPSQDTKQGLEESII